jgi:glycopeptide antibiotics resistance protein
MPLYVVFRIIYIKKRGRRVEIKKEIPPFIFFMYMVAILSQTILPMISINTPGGVFPGMWRGRFVNLVPFETIKMYLTMENDSVTDWGQLPILNLLGNIGLFVPFGLLFPVVSSRHKFIYTLCAGAVFSLLIEVIQYFIGRSSDVDDLILNTAGSCVGFLLFFVIVKPFIHRDTGQYRVTG